MTKRYLEARFADCNADENTEIEFSVNGISCEVWDINKSNGKVCIELDLPVYDYREAVKSDIEDFILTDCEKKHIANRSDFAEYLNDTLFVSDCVTGNASGSYTFNSHRAEMYLVGNMDLLKEAISEFGGDMSEALDSAESADVTIRCYLLGECIEAALDELEEKGQITYLDDSEDESEEEE